MFEQQQIPADRRAKAPDGRRRTWRRSSKAFQQVANDDGLLLYTDWASPSMYTTLQNQFQLLLAGRTDARRHGEGRPGRLGEVRQDAPLITRAWRSTRRSRRGAPGPGRSGRAAEAPRARPAARARRPAQHRLALRPPGARVLRPLHARAAPPHRLLLAVRLGRPDARRRGSGSRTTARRSATSVLRDVVRPLGDPDRLLRGLPGDHRAAAHGGAHAHARSAASASSARRSSCRS